MPSAATVATRILRHMIASRVLEDQPKNKFRLGWHALTRRCRVGMTSRRRVLRPNHAYAATPR